MSSSVPVSNSTTQQTRASLTLDDGIHDPLLLRTRPPRGQIHRHRLVDLDEGGLLVDYVELMLVRDLVIASAQLTDCLIVLVQEGGVAMTMTIAGVVVTLKAKQHVLALPARHLEIGRPDRVVAVSGPDELAVIAEDIRRRLAGTVHFA